MIFGSSSNGIENNVKIKLEYLSEENKNGAVNRELFPWITGS